MESKDKLFLSPILRKFKHKWGCVSFKAMVVVVVLQQASTPSMLQALLQQVISPLVLLQQVISPLVLLQQVVSPSML